MKQTQVELRIKGPENGSKDLDGARRALGLDGIAIRSSEGNHYMNFVAKDGEGAVGQLGRELARNYSGHDCSIANRRYTLVSGDSQEPERIGNCGRIMDFYDGLVREEAA